MSRLQEYLAYHRQSLRIGDIDPSHKMLLYVSNRFELTVEQRYWLSFLYALCYCGATVYYIYNEFPDEENVDRGRMERWWSSVGRDRSLFQTDSRWRRSRNQVVDAVESYRKWVGNRTQEEHFALIATGDTPEKRYDQVYRQARNLYTMGQFSLFNYIESLHTITPLDLCPTDLDFDKAWSPRDGLYYAFGLDQYILDDDVPIPAEAREETKRIWAELRSQLGPPNTVWNLETTLCAYRKYCRTLEGKAGATGKRWVGFYLDRQADEIAKIEDRVKDGVCWRVLWDYRRETYDPEFLAENYHGVSPSGIHPKWKEFGMARTKELIA